MPALHVCDLEDAVIAALKARARKHRRSLQGEVRSILEAVVSAGGRRRSRLRTVRVGGPARFSREIVHDDDGR